MVKFRFYFIFLLGHSFDSKDALVNYVVDVNVGNGASTNCLVK